MRRIVAGLAAAIIATALLIWEFEAIAGWMVAHAVDPTIASVIAAAAVFGEISIGVMIVR